MTETISQYIPIDRRAEYEAAGWDVTDNLGHHDEYSLLATKRTRPVFMHKMCTDGVLSVTIAGETYTKVLDKRALSSLLADAAQALSIMMRDEI